MLKDLSNLSENELLLLFQKGEESAFEEIHNRYFFKLYAHACRMLRDEEEAGDVIQEVFVSFWVKGKSLELKTGLSAYLYTATRNKVLNVIEHNRVHSHHLESLRMLLEESHSAADEHISVQELSAIIEKEIQNLPPQMRTVFELSRKEELSHKEIAENLSISPKTVKKQISNAIKILKMKLVYLAPQVTVFYSLLAS